MSRESIFFKEVTTSEANLQAVYANLGLPVGTSLSPYGFHKGTRGVGNWEFGARVAIAYRKYLNAR